MVTTFTRREVGKVAGNAALGAGAMFLTPAHGQERSPDERARETEQKMTDEERFSLIFSLLGPVSSTVQRDPRIPKMSRM